MSWKDHQSVPLKELAASGAVALTGKITDSASGFYRSGIDTVYEVAVDQYLWAPDQESRPALLYFVFDWGAIKIGDDYLCSPTARGEYVRPELGSSVLLVLDDEAATPDSQMVRPLDHQVFFTLADGSVSFPARYPDPTVSDLDKLIAQLRQAVSAK